MAGPTGLGSVVGDGDGSGDATGVGSEDGVGLASGVGVVSAPAGEMVRRECIDWTATAAVIPKAKTVATTTTATAGRVHRWTRDPLTDE